MPAVTRRQHFSTSFGLFSNSQGKGCFQSCRAVGLPVTVEPSRQEKRLQLLFLQMKCVQMCSCERLNDVQPWIFPAMFMVPKNMCYYKPEDYVLPTLTKSESCNIKKNPKNRRGKNARTCSVRFIRPVWGNYTCLPESAQPSLPLTPDVQQNCWEPAETTHSDRQGPTPTVCLL